jgi:hypothetical protein
MPDPLKIIVLQGKGYDRLMRLPHAVYFRP